MKPFRVAAVTLGLALAGALAAGAAEFVGGSPRNASGILRIFAEQDGFRAFRPQREHRRAQ